MLYHIIANQRKHRAFQKSKTTTRSNKKSLRVRLKCWKSVFEGVRVRKNDKKGVARSGAIAERQARPSGALAERVRWTREALADRGRRISHEPLGEGRADEGRIVDGEGGDGLAVMGDG